MDRRGAGILLHITSLPSADGVGNFGPGAYSFVDFLAEAGQSYWQVLPLGPPSPGEGNSPYSSSSAFAGNTLLISPELLVRDGYLAAGEIPTIENTRSDRIDYASATDFKRVVLDLAWERFRAGERPESYAKFLEESAYWLDDYALFVTLKNHFGEIGWSDWPADIRDRRPEAMSKYASALAEEIEKQKFFQYLFNAQWDEIKGYANKKGIRIVGDLPIYMSLQSADTWAHPEIFKLDTDKRPRSVAGVPPDYFSQTGQLWGNPVYDWKRLVETEFDWWVRRIRHNLRLYDILRIDHFRGLVACWEIPAGARTAIDGEWVPVPGDRYFARLREVYTSLPIIAEDLGTITPDVREFIAKLGIPGMKVLLFAFGESLPENLYAPHNHVKNSVIYTGTHDNNTIRGWFESEATEAEKKSLSEYVGREVTAEVVSEVLVRMAMMSVADTVLIPIQDHLGLGAKSRMNTPSVPNGNWEWRLKPELLGAGLLGRLRKLTQIYARLPEQNRQRAEWT